jgi:hypothetical protein
MRVGRRPSKLGWRLSRRDRKPKLPGGKGEGAVGCGAAARAGLEPLEAANRTWLQAKLDAQFLIGHSGETIEVTVQPQTESAVRLVRITTEANDGGMIGFVREKFRQEKAVLRIDELRHRRLLREADEALPKLGRPVSDAPA